MSAAGGFRPALTDEDLKAIVEKWEANGHNISQTAKDLNLARGTVQHHLKSAAKRGLVSYDPVMPGFQVSRVSTRHDRDGVVVGKSIVQTPEPAEEDFQMPGGQALRKGTFHLSADGRLKQQWLKTGEEKIDPKEFVAGLMDAFKESYTPHQPARPSHLYEGDSMSLLPLADLHLGMHVWGKDASENWDLKIGRRVITDTCAAIITRTQPSELFTVLGGGDQTHANDGTNRTQASGHLLNVDGRFKKTGLESGLMWVDIINIALGCHKNVLVRILPGNHDPEASFALAMFLWAWFREDERVTVDIDPSWFWFHQWGNVFNAATHGDKTPIQKLPMKMAYEMSAMWGATTMRYGHSFHLHRAEKALLPEEGGVQLERHRTIIPADNYAFDHSFISGRSAQSITFDKRFGEIARVVRRPVYE